MVTTQDSFCYFHVEEMPHHRQGVAVLQKRCNTEIHPICSHKQCTFLPIVHPSSGLRMKYLQKRLPTRVPLSGPLLSVLFPSQSHVYAAPGPFLWPGFPPAHHQCSPVWPHVPCTDFSPSQTSPSALAAPVTQRAEPPHFR